MKRWRSMFCEADGSWSMTRTCLAFMTSTVFGGWLGLSISTVCRGGKLLDIPWGVVSIVGFGWGVKGWQKPHESEEPCAPPAP